MSQEPEEKPKLNLNISYNGNQITVKVKANMKFSKIFAAAEQKFQKEAELCCSPLGVTGTFKFTFEGQRLQPDDTPASLGMEDGDQIDAFLEQLGGGFWLARDS
ncbi:hypothetical protein H2248_002028 [Termitomyces sp. 'cryptogamus']|nr:hypothetical protein H2248_002028 [Termitomyces sp. 'cryptogamus']